MKIVSLLAVAPAARALVTGTTSAGALLQAAGARNVTQMAGLLQNLAQESLDVEGDGVEQLEPTIKKALEVIRGNLVKNIRDTLAQEHKVDQDDIMRNVECFTQCDVEKREGESKCQTFEDEAEVLNSQHASCRTTLMASYVKKIQECNALDDWVANFKLEKKIKEFCVYDGAYVCHMKECPESSPCTPSIDAKFGNWLQGIITSATSGWDTWSEFHGKCKAAYHSYIEKDAECDVKQKSFELKKCGGRKCRDRACNEQYAACRARCDASYHATNKRVECAEKDRKIDWSATEKIECFLRILLASPSSTDVQEHCQDKTKCLSEWRTNEFNKCSNVCEEVDFDSGSYSQHARRGASDGAGLDYNTFWHESQQPLRQHADMQVHGDSTWGVNTTHRVSDKASADHEKRCTQHLDIDFQPVPDCEPCAEEEPMPCSEVFLAKYYQRFTLMDEVPELAGMAYRQCHTESPGEHTQKWAYNLCECRECGKPLGDVCSLKSEAAQLEVGSVTTDDTQAGGTFDFVKQYVFKRPFSKTPVVVGLMGSNGHHSAQVQFFDITTHGFRYAVVEPAGWDGKHVSEKISFIAAVPGLTEMGGLKIEAGIVSTAHTVAEPTFEIHAEGSPEADKVDGKWEPRTFTSSFDAKPALLTSIQSSHNQDFQEGMDVSLKSPWLVVATTDLSEKGFKVSLDRCEVKDGTTVSSAEDVGFIAISSGSGEANGVKYSVQYAETSGANMGWDDMEDGIMETVTFHENIPEALIIGSQSSRNGNNGGWLRLYSQSERSAVLVVDEDIQNDDERNHMTEEVSLAAFSDAFSFP